MSPSEPTWADDLREMSRALVSAGSPEDGLGALCRIARAALPMCDHAGMTLVNGGKPTSRGATDPLLLTIDAAQHEARCGPCVEAARDDEVVICDDVLEAADRWPDFSRVAAAAGVASTLSIPLSTGNDALGALNCYSGLVRAFGPEDVETASTLAVRATALLMAVVPMWDAQATVEQLHEAVETRQVIGQATGILIANRGISSDEAFAMLRQQSTHQNRKLRVIATEIVAAHNQGQAGLN